MTDVAVLFLDPPDELWFTDGRCLVAVEVLSPGELAAVKSAHYAAHGVGVYLEIDPIAQTVVGEDHTGWHETADSLVTLLTAKLFTDE